MKIEQLKLENFKCFKTEKTFDFGRLTILTGANSSGKSTVMQAILSIIQSNHFPFNYSPNGKYVRLGDFNNLTHHGNENPIKLSVKTTGKDQIVERTTTWLKNPKTLLPDLQHLYGSDGHDKMVASKGKDLYNIEFTFLKEADATYCYKMLKDSFERAGKVGLPPIQFEKRVQLDIPLSSPFLVEMYRYFIRGLFKYIGAFRALPFRTYMEKNNYKFEMGNNGDGYIDQILDWEKHSDDKLQELTQILKKLGLLKAVKMKRLNGGRFEILVKTNTHSTWTPLSNVGSGVGQLLPILVADLQSLPVSHNPFATDAVNEVNEMYQNNQSTFLMEEPETHLHPSVQSKLAAYMIENVQKTDKNYVIETHSEYFLNRTRLAIVKGELKPSDLKVYFLENAADDTSVYEVQFALNGAIKNAPKRFFETYSMDVMQIALNS
jgi:predicted ATPase